MPFNSPSLILIAAAYLTFQPAQAAETGLQGSIPGPWEKIGRVAVTQSAEEVTISNGWLADLHPLRDCEMSFRARMPSGSDQVQIWGAIRVRDRDSRYVFALRGGAEPEMSLARYAPDGQSRFLGYAPLDFTPEPGKWYTLRVAVAGSRFHVYLNDEALPRINAEDRDALWKEGGIGLGGGWLPTVFAELKVEPLTGAKLAAFDAIGDSAWKAPAVDRSAMRAKQRAGYLPAAIGQLPPARGEFSLNGNWLFIPDQDLAPAAQPAAVATDDRGWNILPVPGFWTPTLGWLHGEFGLPGLKGLSASKGPSDQLIAGEYARCDAQTFDWKNTKSGWYRHYLDLPPDLAGREFHLVFDAVAKVADVWVNGAKAGSHTGMFGEIDIDVTQALRPGRNVIAVHDVGVPESDLRDASTVAAEAVTVAVTNQMLRSLPHGMTDLFSGGIWQPVKLVVTDPVHISDVFVRPGLDGAQADLELENDTSRARSVSLSYSVTDAGDRSILDVNKRSVPAEIPPHGKTTLTIATAKVSPKPWSPATPNLYYLTLTLDGAGTTLDVRTTRFGFRTFSVSGGKLLLNGKPYWLRGGDHFPATLRPNDSALAHQFIKLAREGNVCVTRSHAIPFTGVWLDAADELGMGVSYEGTWPWLMLAGPPPDPALLAVWREEFASLLKEYRNHPSLLMWTVNNEMKFEFTEKLGPEVLRQKWSILDGMIRTMRRIDPTRPIVPDSSYTRKEAGRISGALREKHHFDDGDIDDSHRYYGTYSASPFHLFDGEFGKENATPGRPLISQEMSTGYPRNDDWPSRSYEFPRYVPQAIAGDYAFEQNDPSVYMTRQAFLTKELAEALRRADRADASGIMHFAYLTWFTDVWKAGSIRPKLTYYELKRALQPVLVSAELYGRHFYAGDNVMRRVCIANDSENAQVVPTGTLAWQITARGRVLSRGVLPTPVVEYYTNRWLDVNIQMPTTLPEPRINAVLTLKMITEGRTVSENSYDIVIATRAWASMDPATAGSIQLFDPHGLAGPTLSGFAPTAVDTLDKLDPTKLLIVGDTGAVIHSAGGAERLLAFVQAGGRVLLLQPGADLATLFPAQVRSYRKAVGEIVTMTVPESPVFDGIEPLDTAWFEMGNRRLPFVCGGTYQIDRASPGVTPLALECDLHPDIPKEGFFKIAGYPIVELHLGKGSVLASEMMLSARERDPISGRLLRNMISDLLHR